MAYRPGSGLSKAFQHIVELFSRKRVAERVDMSGRKVIVTGATPGSIGYQVARTLALWGADVAVTCPRDADPPDPGSGRPDHDPLRHGS